MTATRPVSTKCAPNRAPPANVQLLVPATAIVPNVRKAKLLVKVALAHSLWCSVPPRVKATPIAKAAMAVEPSATVALAKCRKTQETAQHLAPKTPNASSVATATRSVWAANVGRLRAFVRNLVPPKGIV